MTTPTPAAKTTEDPRAKKLVRLLRQREGNPVGRKARRPVAGVDELVSHLRAHIIDETDRQAR